MSDEDTGQRTFDTTRFPTVRGTLEALRKGVIEYEDLKDERKDPLLEFLIGSHVSMGPAPVCRLLFEDLASNPGAVAGIICDLYMRATPDGKPFEFVQHQRLKFLLWATEQKAKLDVTTFDYIFRQLPASLTERFDNGTGRMVRDAKRGTSGREGKSA